MYGKYFLLGVPKKNIQIVPKITAMQVTFTGIQQSKIFGIQVKRQTLG